MTNPKENPKEDPKTKAREAAIKQIKQRYGETSIMKMGERLNLKVTAIPTGSISLDQAIGVGGIPRGRVTEIYGPESSGKTTVCLHAVAEAQKLGESAAFIDMEHALDPSYAEKIGVNVDELMISQPSSGEEALEITETLVRSGSFALIIVDSVAALVPRNEIEGDMGDAQMGAQARLMSQALRKLNAAVSETNTALIFTNQLRQKIGVMFGNPETTTGGNALKFYASVRIDIRRVSAIKNGMEVVGSRTKTKIAKNKVAPPFKTVEFDIMYNEGISVAGDVLDLAVERDIVEKRGAYYSYKETRLGQGRENAKVFLKEHPDILTSIRNEIMSSNSSAGFSSDDDEND